MKTIIRNTLLLLCFFFGSYTPEQVDPLLAEFRSHITSEPPIVPPAPNTKKGNISIFGDSMSAGSGGGNVPYGNYLQEMLTERTVSTYAISGQQSWQITARQGGRTIKSNASFTFNGTDEVPVVLNLPFFNTGSNSATYTGEGTIGGVKAIVTRRKIDGKENYTIKAVNFSNATVPAGSVLTLDIAQATKEDTQILWMGRNNLLGVFKEVPADYERAIAHMTSSPKRFGAIGIISGADELPGSAKHEEIKEFNAFLKNKYPDNYIESSAPTAAEMQEIGFVPNADEQAEIARNAWPRGLRADQVHLNAGGYKIIAIRVREFLNKSGY